MLIKDFKYQSGKDKYLIIHCGDHVAFKKHNAKKNDFNKKMYKTTYDSCTCAGRMFRPKKACRHMGILFELQWTLKKKDVSKTLGAGIKSMDKELVKIWNDAFEDCGITDQKERKWMLRNVRELTMKYKIKSVWEAHHFWLEQKKGLISFEK